MPPFMLALVTVQKIAFWERKRRRVMQLVNVIGPAGRAAGPGGYRVQRFRVVIHRVHLLLGFHRDRFSRIETIDTAETAISKIVIVRGCRHQERQHQHNHRPYAHHAQHYQSPSKYAA